MHRLRDWRASRSGPRMTISGRDDSGRLVKVPAVSIQVPDRTRVTCPAGTIGVQPDGEIVVLA